jgi:hypothetical protein
MPSLASHCLNLGDDCLAPFAGALDGLCIAEPVELAEGLEAVALAESVPASPCDDIRLFVKGAPGGVEIVEAGSGDVGALRIRNASDAPVLVIAGQLVRGGKQNRGVNADVLVLPRTEVGLPVTCVERGRWTGGAADRSRFTPEGFEPMFVREAKHRHVDTSRRVASRAQGVDGSAHCAADQLHVWRLVSEFGASTRSATSSEDLLDSLRTVEGREHHHRRAELPFPRDRVGIMFFLDGEFLAGDLFASPDWQRELEPWLVRSALASRDFAAARGRLRRRHHLDERSLEMGERHLRHLLRPSEWDDRRLDVGQTARSVLADVIRGRWCDRPSVGAERVMAVDHPFVRSTATLDRSGALLHLQLGTVRTHAAFSN